MNVSSFWPVVVPLCPQRAVGSIRGTCVNTVSPSSLPPRFTGLQPFFLYLPYHSTTTSPSCSLSTVPFFLSERQPLSSLHWWELLSSYTIHPLPSRSLTSPCTFAFSGLYKPSHLYSHPYFFSALQFPPLVLIFASVCIISLFLLCLSISIVPFFFSISPLLGRQMLTLAD